ncbi:MAG: hypothetical protein Q9219_003717 [cf. Caloplaca sp. 3 TL-2023]
MKSYRNPSISEQQYGAVCKPHLIAITPFQHSPSLHGSQSLGSSTNHNHILPTPSKSIEPFSPSNPFPFFQLPPEIRTLIYGLWFIHEHPIALESVPSQRQIYGIPLKASPCDVEGVPLRRLSAMFDDMPPESEDYQSPKLERLTTRGQYTVPERWPTLFVRFLCTCKTAHEEVVAMLYGRNTFQFIGDQCWHDLAIFSYQIGERGRQNVHRLTLEYPDTTTELLDSRKNVTHHTLRRLMKAGLLGLNEVRKFTRLTTLNLRVYEDLEGSRAIDMLRLLRRYLKEASCHVVLDFLPDVPTDDPVYEAHDFIRTEPAAVEALQAWKWELQGPWIRAEIVDLYPH